MKVSAIPNTKISFGRSLNNDELEDFNKTKQECKNLTNQTGKSIFIVHDATLPQAPSRNTGVGNLSSTDSINFFKYMQPYLDFNMVEVLPQGQYAPFNKLYCAYTSTALSLGNHLINPELLTTKEFENLLTQEEYSQIVNNNTLQAKDYLANYHNVLDNDGTQNNILKIAYERFKKLPDNSNLKNKYNTYIKQNSDWLNITRKSEPDTDFFKFKQFLADEHLKIGKQKLNDMGIKLCGDCLIGFSQDEVNAYPNAFKKDHFIGDPEWKLPALDYDKITDPNSDAAKLLKRKVQLFAQRYDAIRFDVGWAYISPVVTPKGEHHILDKNKKYLNDNVLKFIENAVKEIKGQDFDLHNLMYELDADPETFSMWKPNSSEQIDATKGRVKILGSTYMHWDDSLGWGFNEAYIKRGWDPKEYVLGIGNHDPQPLKQIAKGIPEKILLPDGTIIEAEHKQPAIRALAKIFHIPEDKLQNPTEFAKAKWADTMQAYNRQMFYMDVFGREERFDMQGFNTTVHPEKNYAYKIPINYKQAYQSAIQEGFGFNIMDSFERLFKLKGLDKTYPDLFSRIIKYKNILLEPEPNEILQTTNQETPQIKNESKPIADTIKKSSKKAPWIIGTVLTLGAATGLYIKKYARKKENMNPIQNNITTDKKLTTTNIYTKVSINKFI